MNKILLALFMGALFVGGFVQALKVNNNMPEGSYLGSCDNVQFSRQPDGRYTLSAMCKDPVGKRIPSFLNNLIIDQSGNVGVVLEDIHNNNGYLTYKSL
jgi:hypothetical protein